MEKQKGIEKKPFGIPNGFLLSFLEFDFLFDVCCEIFDLDSLLLHSIAVTNCYAAVFFAFEVICDAYRSSDFILATITLAD